MSGFLDNYTPVADRIAAFYAREPCGAIRTTLVTFDEKVWVVRAEVYREDEADPWATGYAHEVEGQGNVNRTSALENCETSAIGRALANAGFAATGPRPSREEMAGAAETITAEQAAELRARLEALGHYPPTWIDADLGNRSALEQMPARRYAQAVAVLDAEEQIVEQAAPSSEQPRSEAGRVAPSGAARESPAGPPAPLITDEQANNLDARLGHLGHYPAEWKAAALPARNGVDWLPASRYEEAVEILDRAELATDVV